VSDYRDGARTREVSLTPLGERRYRAQIDGAEIEVWIETGAAGRMRLTVDGVTTVARVTASGERRFVRLGHMDYMLQQVPRGSRRGGAGHGQGLEAPMPGVVTRVMAAAGEAVTKGQPLVALEAMKMEHLIRAPHDGVVKSIPVEAGQMVDGGAALAEMEAADE
jgi:biotin carboxyl carrier protein